MNRSAQKRLTTSMLLAGGLIFACAADQGIQAFTQRYEHAAMAVVPQQGRWFWGFAADPSPYKARQLALQRCGNSRCIIVREFKDGECAYVVLGREQVFWASEPPASLRQLLNYCRSIDSDCEVKVEWCSSPVDESGTVDSSGGRIAPLASVEPTMELHRDDG